MTWATSNDQVGEPLAGTKVTFKLEDFATFKKPQIG